MIARDQVTLLAIGAGAMLVLKVALGALWLYRKRIRAAFGRPAVAPPAPYDAAAYFHAMLKPADGGRDVVLYQGRSAVEAKRHFYRDDVKGTITFHDGPIVRGTRVVA